MDLSSEHCSRQSSPTPAYYQLSWLYGWGPVAPRPGTDGSKSLPRSRLGTESFIRTVAIEHGVSRGYRPTNVGDPASKSTSAVELDHSAVERQHPRVEDACARPARSIVNDQASLERSHHASTDKASAPIGSGDIFS